MLARAPQGNSSFFKMADPLADVVLLTGKPEDVLKGLAAATRGVRLAVRIDRFLSSKWVQSLSETLADCRGELIELALFSVVLTDDGATHISHALERCSSSLRFLVLRRIDSIEIGSLHVGITARGLEVLFTSLKACKQLEGLDLSTIPIGRSKASDKYWENAATLKLKDKSWENAVTQKLKKVLEATPHLVKLHLEYCQIRGAKSLGTLCEGIAHCLRLEELCLSGNPIRHKGGLRLAQLLPMLPALHTLALVNCDIRDGVLPQYVAEPGDATGKRKVPNPQWPGACVALGRLCRDIAYTRGHPFKLEGVQISEICEPHTSKNVRERNQQKYTGKLRLPASAGFCSNDAIIHFWCLQVRDQRGVYIQQRGARRRGTQRPSCRA